MGAPMALQPMRGKRARKHDCGDHGFLTVAQIARLAGIQEGSVYKRIADGWRGEDLCQPRRPNVCKRVECSYLGRTVVATSGRVGIAVAVQIARAFPSRPPTVEELRKRFDMSRATAYRWRAAFVDAMGMQA